MRRRVPDAKTVVILRYRDWCGRRWGRGVDIKAPHTPSQIVRAAAAEARRAGGSGDVDAGEGAGWWWWGWGARDGDAHVAQPVVVLDVVVVEPGAGAGFPFEAAEHAEFGCAAAGGVLVGGEEGVVGGDKGEIPGHMVAALLQLNHRATTVAALPTGLLRRFEQAIRLLIVRTLFLPMPLPATQDTHLRLTTAALPVLPTIAFAIIVVVSGLDPLPAPPRRAVNPVLGGVLLELPVPELLEGDVEELVDVLQRDAIHRAALGRHVLGVRDGELEDPSQAGVTHAVAAFELR